MPDGYVGSDLEWTI